MPLGYDTMLRSAASRDVPPPTAQRITLARALAMLPSVLILDEANALLDIAGEQRLIDALERLRGRVTIILAAHRPSLLRLADKVYEISGGGLVEAAIDTREQRPAAS
jgi:ABC-type protease/lipase transport system fused ATPase/permease subunit